MSIQNAKELELIEIEGMTFDADDKTPKDKLLQKQKSRQKSSGIAPKEGGNLTMPGKWKGVVPDRNDSWGDWTNYKFPLHDLAHANNAASRLAQNSGYSSEEKAKIKSRIEKAQKKHGKTNATEIMKTVKIDSEEYKMEKASFFAKADVNTPDTDDAPMSKKDVYAVLSSMYDSIYNSMQSMYSHSMRRDSNIVDQVNSCMQDHAEGHLPKMHPGQVKAVLESAGIEGDFEAPKAPMTAGVPYVYASVDTQKEKLRDLKVDIK